MCEIKMVHVRILAAVFISLALLACISGCGSRYESTDNANASQNISSSAQESYTDTEENSQTADIGYKGAVAIVLAKVPGAEESNVTEIERDYEGGICVYEGELVYGGYEYEFEIDGASGNIIKWEIDD